MLIQPCPFQNPLSKYEHLSAVESKKILRDLGALRGHR